MPPFSDSKCYLFSLQILRVIAKKFPPEEANKYTSTLGAVEAHELFALESTEGVHLRLTCMHSSLRRAVLFVTSRHVCIKLSSAASMHDRHGETIRIPLQSIAAIGRVDGVDSPDGDVSVGGKSFFWGSVALETDVGERIRLYHLHDVPSVVLTVILYL